MHWFLTGLLISLSAATAACSGYVLRRVAKASSASVGRRR